jgi:transposase
MALIAEICDFARFEHPRELMAYLGLVPSERSSGGKSSSTPSRRRSGEPRGRGDVR